MNYKKIKFYIINLDARSDRLQQFLDNKSKLGYVDYIFHRVPAILDLDFGGLGCAKSHVMALIDFIVNSKEEFCAIVEDDFRFRFDSEFFESEFIKLNKIEKFKVWLLAGTKVIRLNNYPNVSEIFESQSCAGYLIRRSYVKEILKVFIDSVDLMEKNRSSSYRNIIYDRFSIDQIWKSLQRQGGWYANIPMIGYQEESYSDIEGHFVNYKNISS